MAEQTNFYAVQRGAPWSFRPVSDGVINWYLYNFGSNLVVAFVERPSNLWVEMPWNCIFRVKNIVFSSASGGRRPPDPQIWAPYIFTSGFLLFPCAHPCCKAQWDLDWPRTQLARCKCMPNRQTYIWNNYVSSQNSVMQDSLVADKGC